MFMNSKYEKERRQQFSMFAAEQRARDAGQIRHSKAVFDNKTNLTTQIERDIFPALVGIETACGRVGMGFFQHERWLVSNAHVIKHRSEIEQGIVLKKSDGTDCLLDAEQAYHRPWDSVVSPDIVVVNTCGIHAVIPSNPLSLDSVYPSVYYFYVDLNFHIHYLAPVSAAHELPIRFQNLDGHIPQEGCSGTPIFSAQLTLGKSPNWRFDTVGALYARCASSSSAFEAMSFLVCAVPIVEEFEQIRSILLALESSESYQQRAKYSALVGDKRQTLIAHNMSEQEAALARQGIQAFEAGHSILEIDLPEGLEKLAKNTFVSLEQSYLHETAELTLNEIKETFANFVSFISQAKNIGIKVTRETTLIYSKYWRLDGKPGTNGQYWVLQLQDNTGKGVKVAGTQKSASSVFAEVKVPVHIEHISGQALGKDLLKSQGWAKKKETLMAQEKTARGAQRKELQRLAEEVTVSIVAGTSDSCSTLQDYTTLLNTEIRRATTPLTLELFNAISEEASDQVAFSSISKLLSDSQRLNTVNDMGDTPLMVLLKDHNLNSKPIQSAKAQLLAAFSIWDQPNTEGKTAAQILNQHPDAECLRMLLSI
jgi:hypothetical protein